MLAGRIADELVDPAYFGPRDTCKFSCIGYSDEDTAAFAVGKRHHFRCKGIHIADILLELQSAILSIDGDCF